MKSTDWSMKYLLYLLFATFFYSCHQADQKVMDEARSEINGPYFGLTASEQAQMFAEGIVSREFQELNAVFHPNGKEFYFTIADAQRTYYVIMQYTMDDTGIWDGPHVASFSGQYADADPYITSDGSALYYISRRPIDITSSSSKDFDIWKVEREGDDWGDPQRLPEVINTNQNEFYVSAIDNGSIFFSSRREGGLGGGDIYEARPVDGSYVVENLGPAINTNVGEGDPYVSPDGNMIIFFSGGREDDLGRGDLYISFKKDGEWQTAKNLGKQINSDQFEYCPMLSPDGKYFFWTSYKASNLDNPRRYDYDSYIDRLSQADNGMGNVYWIDAKVLEQYR